MRVAVVGNPNSGKTTLFNALTGMRQKVGNYPGVTVEKREGSYLFRGVAYRLIDLPGTCSLTATSEDESLVRDLLFGLVAREPPVDMVLLIVDATNLERQMFLASQVLDLGLPLVIALTMNDEARRAGRPVDAQSLSDRTGVPVVEVVAPQGVGVAELRRVMHEARGVVPPAPPWRIGDRVLSAVDELAGCIGGSYSAPLQHRRQLAVQLLLYPSYEHPLSALPGVGELAGRLRSGMDGAGIGWRDAEVRGRYAWIREVASFARAAAEPAYTPSFSDRLDKVLVHPVWGVLIFVVVMAVVFQLVFTWATPVMHGIEWLFAGIGALVGGWLPQGLLRSMVVDGVIGGVGAVVIFLPQIVLLFLALGVLEDSGYMARAAFLMNRHMRRVGLSGRSFIPLLSGFACAIPAIMATRTISDRRDRLVTMLVVPFTSCSARLPVYALVIAAFVPALPLIGGFRGFTLQGLVLTSAYAFSLLAAIVAALVLRRTVLPGPAQPFILELPPYRLPHWKVVLASLIERGGAFVIRAGTIILALNVVLWFLVTFPTHPELSGQYRAQRTSAQQTLTGTALSARLDELNHAEASRRLSLSFGGILGRAVEPALKPLGFDWEIGVAIIGSLAAREVFVSTLAVVFGVGDRGRQAAPLVDRMREKYSPLVGLTIVVFFILSCQCLATVAVVRREAGSWGWALFLYSYMTVTAYVVSLVFYQAASRLWPHLK